MFWTTLPQVILLHVAGYITSPLTINSVEFFSFFFVLYCCVFFVDFLFLCVFPIHPIHLECTLQCHWVVPCTALRSNPTQPPCTTVVWIHPCIVAIQNLFGLGERKAQIRNVACHCTRTPSSTHCCTRPIQDCAPPRGCSKNQVECWTKMAAGKCPPRPFCRLVPRRSFSCGNCWSGGVGGSPLSFVGWVLSRTWKKRWSPPPLF